MPGNRRPGNYPGRLPQRQLEENLDCQAELDRGIGEHSRPSGLLVLRALM